MNLSDLLCLSKKSLALLSVSMSPVCRNCTLLPVFRVLLVLAFLN